MKQGQEDKIKIIFNKYGIVGIHKPVGIVVHKTEHDFGKNTVSDWFINKFPEAKKVGDDTTIRPGVVHRLDKDTSGVLLLARTQEKFLYLKSLFQKQEIKKKYVAIVHGKFTHKHIDIKKPIGLKPGTIKRSVFGTKMIKEAYTELKLIKTFEKDGSYYSIIEAIPHTGRTHQIRVHCAFLGYPIVGDNLYGRKSNKNVTTRQFLHCSSLKFKYQDENIIKINDPIPHDFYEFIK